jgi:hypothetical protein
MLGGRSLATEQAASSEHEPSFSGFDRGNTAAQVGKGEREHTIG